MSQKTYRAAAIGHTGAGNFGHGLHTPYKEIENAEFIAVSDPDAAGRGKSRGRGGCCPQLRRLSTDA